MKRIALACLLFALGAARAAWAGPFAVGDVLLELPPGFVGPEAEALAGGGSLAQFAKPYPCGGEATLLRVAQHAAAPRPARELLRDAGVPEAGLEIGASEALRLGGRPAQRIAWHVPGAEGGGIAGVSYLLAVGSGTLSFHAQDAGAEPSAQMREAMQAIEQLRLR